MRNKIYKKILMLTISLVQVLPENLAIKLLDFVINKNNNFVLKNLKKKPAKILFLLPKCLQYFSCDKNIIDSIENCQQCGKCKIKDILQLGKKYNLVIKVATGGQLAKMFVEQVQPELVIAVACKPELVAGIKNVNIYNVIAIPNIIVDKPCINTDVEINEVEKFLQHIANHE
jgi:hypothetical protein